MGYRVWALRGALFPAVCVHRRRHFGCSVARHWNLRGGGLEANGHWALLRGYWQGWTHPSIRRTTVADVQVCLGTEMSHYWSFHTELEDVADCFHVRRQGQCDAMSRND